MKKYKESWFIKSKPSIENIELVSNMYNISKFFAELLLIRGYNTKNKINNLLYRKDIRSPKELINVEKAVDILLENRNKKIFIIGDYDVDGITSTVVLVKSLRYLGFEVGYEIPDRINDGYGINKRLINLAKSNGYEVIITCDNGIAAVEEIDYAKNLGLTVIITDHHEIQNKIPNADVIVNPHLDKDISKFPNICGCFVAYKFIEVLYDKLNQKMLNLKFYVALATVCDVMDLVDENRVIIKQGFEEITLKTDKALMILLEVLNIDIYNLNVYTLGFVIGPTINAVGRLKNANSIVEMFLSDDEEEIRKFSNKFNELNQTRKEMTDLAEQKVIEQIENSSINNDKILVVYQKDIHESISGIVSGRIKERYNKPVLLMTDTVGCVKGSGRSIEEYDMFNEMCKISELYEKSTGEKLFIKFGGHKMAAGFSISYDKIDILREMLNNNSILTDEDLVKKIMIDMNPDINKVDINFLNEISVLEPFGKGNESIIFALKDVIFEDLKIVGKNKNVYILNYKNKKFIMFNYLNELDINEKFDILYEPQKNEYNGYINVQYIIKYIRKS